MAHKRKLMSLLVASALVAACGGGSDTPTPPSSNTNTDTAPVAAVPATPAANNPPASGASSGPDASTNPPPATDGGQQTPPPSPTVLDQKFNGHMEIVSNQILYLRVNRILYLPITLSEFEGSTGMVDVASGSPIASYPNLATEAAASGCTIERDGTCGIQPPAVAPAAPIAAFGIRIGTHILPSIEGQQVGNQTVVGRIGFDLTERTDSPRAEGTESFEIMRFVIDNVEMTTDQSGRLTAVRVRDGGQIHVYGRNAAGVEVRESIPAPARTVRLLPLVEIPDHEGDTSSTVLFMDLETGFSQAGSRLTALERIAGHFDMSVTLSSVDTIVRPAALATPGFPAVDRREMIGKTITVNTQPPVSGGGIGGTSGSAWIRMYPH